MDSTNHVFKSIKTSYKLLSAYFDAESIYRAYAEDAAKNKKTNLILIVSTKMGNGRYMWPNPIYISWQEFKRKYQTVKIGNTKYFCIPLGE